MLFAKNSKNVTVFSASVGTSMIAEISEVYSEDICFVYANDAELKHCCAILNIPLIRCSSYVFVGDQAKTIVVNWKREFNNLYLIIKLL